MTKRIEDAAREWADSLFAHRAGTDCICTNCGDAIDGYRAGVAAVAEALEDVPCVLDACRHSASHVSDCRHSIAAQLRRGDLP